LIVDPAFANLDAAQITAMIAATIEEHLSPYDLIFCGEGSSDVYARQVGPRLAARLKLPCITAVRKITLAEKDITAERSLEREIAVVRAPLPALVTVLPEINKPRIPGVKDTLGAARKPIIRRGKNDLPTLELSPLITVAIRKAQVERSCVMVENTPEGLTQLAVTLRNKGAL